jgi:hypothetical protein
LLHVATSVIRCRSSTITSHTGQPEKHTVDRHLRPPMRRRLAIIDNDGDGATGDNDDGGGVTGDGKDGDGATGDDNDGNSATGDDDDGDGATGNGATGYNDDDDGDWQRLQRQW